jgi:hypothetical protein
MDYSKTKEIIYQTSILPKEDIVFINENITEIQHNWEKKQKFRTETEMRISVLNDMKHPTFASKYWQCVREQSGFYEALIQTSFEYRRNKLKQAKKQVKMDRCKDPLKRELLQIDLEELQFIQLNLEQEAKDRMREIRLWSTLMQECIDNDSSFDTEDVNQHQLVSYAQKLSGQVATINENTPMGERNNIVGVLKTANRVLQEKGMVKIEGDKVVLLRDK